MKNILPILLGAALLPLAAQATSTSNVVGYVTASINANVSGSPAGAATFISASFTEVAEYASAATASPSGGSVISLPSGVPATYDGTYMLEITNGAEEGWWTTIVSSADTSITVVDTFPAGLAADVGVSVRKFTTVQSLFGDNSLGLTPYDGVSGDNIQILDPATQGTQTIIYLPASLGGPGWFDFVTTLPADDAIIYPGTAAKVVHYDNTILSLVSNGEVKTTKTQLDVFPLDNWLGQPNPGGGTLGSMEFVTQLVQYDGVRANDFLVMTRPDPGTGQPADTYVALDPTLGAGEIMADFVTTADATDEPVAESTGYLIRRDAGEAASVITIPAQVIGD